MRKHILKSLWPLRFALCEPHSPHKQLSLEILHVEEATL